MFIAALSLIATQHVAHADYDRESLTRMLSETIKTGHYVGVFDGENVDIGVGEIEHYPGIFKISVITGGNSPGTYTFYTLYQSPFYDNELQDVVVEANRVSLKYTHFEHPLQFVRKWIDMTHDGSGQLSEVRVTSRQWPYESRTSAITGMRRISSENPLQRWHPRA